MSVCAIAIDRRNIDAYALSTFHVAIVSAQPTKMCHLLLMYMMIWVSGATTELILPTSQLVLMKLVSRTIEASQRQQLAFEVSLGIGR